MALMSLPKTLVIDATLVPKTLVRAEISLPMALVAPPAMALISLPRTLVRAEISLPIALVAPFKADDTKLPIADVAPPTIEVISLIRLVSLRRTDVRKVLGFGLLRAELRPTETERDRQRRSEQPDGKDGEAVEELG